MQARDADVTFEFGNFRLNRRSGELCRTDTDPPVPVPIGRRALDVLYVLLAHPGHLVTRQEIMDAVWPGLAVEDNNLTVQISALRRCLDRSGERSCIENIPGRGYRFVLPVRAVESGAAEPASEQSRRLAEASLAAVPQIARRPWLGWAAASAALLVGAGGLATLAWVGHSKGPPPRMSLAVLPFEVPAEDPVLDRFADQVAETLTTDLANPASLGYFDPSLVAPRQAVFAQSQTSVDPRAVGAALDMRYVLTGRVRRLSDKLQITVELVSTETGILLWSEQYEDAAEAALADPNVMARWIRPGVVTHIIRIEAARSLRERPTNPDGMDLLLQGRSLEFQGPSPQRIAKSRALYERALQLEPASVNARSALANALLDWIWLSGQPAPGGFARIEKLVGDAEALAPNNPEVLWVRGYLLWHLGRWLAAEAAFQRLLASYPTWAGAELMLGLCYELLGKTDDAIGMFQFSIRKSPKHPYIWSRYHVLAVALLLAGRHEEAVSWEQRALAAQPENSPKLFAEEYLTLAGAYAGLGRKDEARGAVGQAIRSWPFATVRGYWSGSYPSPRFAAQMATVEKGLRSAGLRDHANEDAETAVPPQTELRGDLIGLTPGTVPGANTIRTPDLVDVVATQRPIIIDTVGKGRSIPGAIGLFGAGSGGGTADPLQAQLRQKIDSLTHGNSEAPMVTLDWNAERWGGYNLALRLATLGYTRVSWYRGGQECWQASGCPTADLVAEDW